MIACGYERAPSSARLANFQSWIRGMATRAAGTIRLRTAMATRFSLGDRRMKSGSPSSAHCLKAIATPNANAAGTSFSWSSSVTASSTPARHSASSQCPYSTAIGMAARIRAAHWTTQAWAASPTWLASFLAAQYRGKLSASAYGPYTSQAVGCGIWYG